MSATIVVGYSPDEFGRAALARGVEEARLRNARVLVVNATRGDAYVDERYASADHLTQLREELDGSDVEVEVRQSMGTDVAEQVLGAATETDAILVVIGTRRRTPVGKLLMGSVAQRVILGAECAVLTVKPQH